MDANTFMKHRRKRFERTEATFINKGAEYDSIENPFNNFEEGIGMSTSNTREAVAYGFLIKHLQSIKTIIGQYDRDRTLPTEGLIIEKFGDAIAYLTILEAMFLERQHQTNDTKQ